jgi:hypothetical protein
MIPNEKLDEQYSIRSAASVTTYARLVDNLLIRGPYRHEEVTWTE